MASVAGISALHPRQTFYKPNENNAIMRVLVTGATGFVGQAVCGQLVAAGYAARPTARRLPFPTDDVNVQAEWRTELAGCDARLLAVPESLIAFGAAMTGQRATVQRLCGSLQLDIAPTRALLGWQPPLRVDEGLRRAALGLT